MTGHRLFTGLLLGWFMSRAIADGVESIVDGVESRVGLPAEAAADENAHRGTTEDNTIELNRTRYTLDNLTVETIDQQEHHFKVSGETAPYPDRASLIHPYLWTYFIQIAFAIVAAFMSLYCPLTLLALLVAAVLVWPISWFCNVPIFAMFPNEFMWWMMCIKSVIVNIAPTVPTIYVIVARPDKQVRQYVGLFAYSILWANVFWTLFFPMPQQIMKVNGCVGASLCLSLFIHLLAMCKGGVTLCEIRNKILVGYGTSLSWLVCYTVWNALFVADFAVGLTLQDILFWCIMFFYYYESDCARSIECYFSMARPIQLSTYIAVSDWTGLIPFFRNAPGIGLDVNRHAYILCIACMNFIYSLYVLWQAVILFMHPEKIPKEWKESVRDLSDDMLSDSGSTSADEESEGERKGIQLE